MKILTKSLPFTPVDLKGSSPSAVKGRTFSGLSSTSDLDLGGDIVEPEAFRETLSDGHHVLLIDSHQYDSVRHVVGRLTDWEIQPKGLWTRFSVVKSADGDEILARVQDGLVDGLSIGYRVPAGGAETNDRTGVRTIKKLDLFEVSLVIRPMNPDARITDPAKAWSVADPRRRMSELRLRRLRAQRLLGGSPF